MINAEEISIEIKKYLRKLSKVINNDASFTFFKIKIVNKKKIDDVICCIEAVLPEEYKLYVKKYGVKRLKFSEHYQSLISVIRRKTWFDANSYSVLHGVANGLISIIITNITADMKKVRDADFNMF